MEQALINWDIETRLKKLEGNDLESIVASGMDRLEKAVSDQLDAVENPYSIKKDMSQHNWSDVLYSDLVRSRQLSALGYWLDPRAGYGDYTHYGRQGMARPTNLGLWGLF